MPLFAQNLITNPGFEEIDSCYGAPAGIGFDVFEWSGCKGWSNPIAASSDLWCENPVVGNQSPPSIPSLEYQYPRTGDNMAGIVIEETILSYREYLQNELQSALLPLHVYQFRCYVSVAGLPCTVSNFGVKFNTSRLDEDLSLNLYELIPNVTNDGANFLSDSLGWQLLEFEYIASGGERFVIIGCFDDSSELISVGCENNFSEEFEANYYFIDDVSLVDVGVFELPNVLTSNGDGINDVLDFTDFGDQWQISVFNRWGNTIATLNSDNPIWNPTDDKIHEGTYFIHIKTQGFETVRSLSVFK